MGLNRLFILCLIMWSASAGAAPELSEDNRQRLADGTSDFDSQLDQQDGLYVLLRNASRWNNDDFAGDAGAAVAPPPDYDFIRENPAKARGNVYLIEGWLAQHDRYPSQDNHAREALVRAGDPDWGDQVTRWTVVTKKGDRSATVIVLFNDPTGKIADPGVGAKVRAAARFYKLWMIPDVHGTPFTYPVFVGGAAKVVAGSSSGTPGGGPGSKTLITLALVAVAGAFFFIRYISRGKGRGTMTLQRLEAIRRERERYEEEAEEAGEEDEDLPDDPGAALDVLRQRHEAEG